MRATHHLGLAAAVLLAAASTVVMTHEMHNYPSGGGGGGGDFHHGGGYRNYPPPDASSNYYDGPPNYNHYEPPRHKGLERRRTEVICLEAARNTTRDPVCANDGQTFQNILAFQCYVRFFHARGLSVRRGECARQPEPDYCIFSFVVWRQVCGADNVTYSSPWELMCNAQRTRVPNHVVYDGPCRLRCAMSLVYDPVCGTDGVDYPNPEALRCAAQRHPGLQEARRGPCTPVAPGAWCRAMARMRGGESPVCASNGVTYPSHAHVLCLREYNPSECKLRIRHDGPCRMEDVDTRPLDAVRLCHFADHTALWMPLCASDGHTYANLFVFKCAQARLLMPKDVSVEHAGECPGAGPGQPGGEGRAPDAEDEDACKRAAAEPRVIDRPLFCANDGRTYYNHRHYTCAVQRDGDWFPYRIVRLNMPCEAADTPCERLRLVPDALRVDPICANDGATYASPLALMCAMANNEGLKRHHRGQCLTASEEEGGHGHDHGQGGNTGSQAGNNSNNGNGGSNPGGNGGNPNGNVGGNPGGNGGGNPGGNGGGNPNGNGGGNPGDNGDGNSGGNGGTAGDNTGGGTGNPGPGDQGGEGGDDYDEKEGGGGGEGTRGNQNQQPQGSPETPGSPGSEGSHEPQPVPPSGNPRRDEAEELDLSREPR